MWSTAWTRAIVIEVTEAWRRSH